MRIKCPNTEVFLELPGDRTDMKFTCPACHKMHRVTVSITTPGEDPAPGSTSALAKQQPNMPKKYATGAYPPVVDIPIDANFVLVEASADQTSVDLGQAAPAPDIDDELFQRQTEIIDRRKQAEERGEAAGEETVRDDGGEDEEEAESRRARLERRRRSAARERARRREEEEEDDWSSAGARGGLGRGILLLLLIAALAAAGYLGWNQYQYGNIRKDVAANLERADQAWRRGDAAASAAAARQAQTALQRGREYYTFDKALDTVAKWTGFFSPAPPADAEAERRIRQHLDRERKLDAFRRGLDPSDADGMASALRKALDGAKDDPALADAMQNAVVRLNLEYLRNYARENGPARAADAAEGNRALLARFLNEQLKSSFERDLTGFAQEQRQRLNEEIEGEMADLAVAAAAGDADAITRYLALEERLAHANAGDLAAFVSGAEEMDREHLEQLARLSELVKRANRSARTILTRADEDDGEIDELIQRADADKTPSPVLAVAAAGLIDNARAAGEDLVRLRAEIYGRIQAEMRRNRTYPGTRLAWSMLRIGFDDEGVEIDPSGFQFDNNRASMDFILHGAPARMEMNKDDYEKAVRATIDGYHFTSGWALLFRKPVNWMATLASAMRAAGVDARAHPQWEVLEGPGGPLALSARPSGTAMASLADGGGRHVFFNGKLYPVTELPVTGDAAAMVEEFRAAAVRLHDGVMADESIPQSLRQALKPVLMGTYQKPDPRDYFDSAFCRRLIEANYLETYIIPMPADRQRELAAYRAALGKLEAGFDDFAVDLGAGERLVAVARLDADLSGGVASDQDMETGETVPRYVWRVEKPEETVFFSPLPSRFVYAFMLADHYDGRHRTVPSGRPRLTEVWHAGKGLVASYASGADKATGDEELWNAAIASDLSGRYDPTIGPPGWNFPLHVLERDDQGDPLTLATLSGIVKSPDFSLINDEGERRAAEEAWLDSTAETLSTPGELGLIFHQFFRYCSDSPMPELPNLIGSHYGLSDTHQTVHQSLERRWVGRLIGDCDDLAEFFQVLTSRQGKLSHVMQLPGHAACGYVEKNEEGRYVFVVLQTGPVLQFAGSTLNEAVETAYRSFDRGEGMSHMTTDAVPLLLRFADEETRTPFVLSARIYADREYAETMIQVQAYWHEHAYSAALKIMQDMVKEDQEIGNIKELGSLYERVGMYDESAEMRYRELDMVKDNSNAAISTLLEIVQLHFQDKDKAKALEALGKMEERFQAIIDEGDIMEFFRTASFRSFWAMYLSRLGQPARAWEQIRYDVNVAKRQQGRASDPVLRTLVVMYDRMCMQREAAGGTLPKDEERALAEVRRELEEAFGRGYFKADDSYNNIISRYFVLGRFAVSDTGRKAGLALLDRDGPYARAPKDQTKRTRGIDNEDWEWFRITPQLYLALALEMLDPDEYPELFDPAAAKTLLENVGRAVRKGTGLGSDVAGSDDEIKAELTLSFINRDIEAFRRAMAVVKEKDYSSLYDDAALTFGLHCGLVPPAEFGPWTEAFREYFPGSQHYFKVVYRAIDKENYDHALMMAEATARFFPDHALLRDEADFIRSIIPSLKTRKLNRDMRARWQTGDSGQEQPAA